MRKELDMTCAIWAQEQHNKLAENKAEVRRAENRKRNGIKEDLMCFVSGLSVVTIVMALYFIMCLF